MRIGVEQRLIPGMQTVSRFCGTALAAALAMSIVACGSDDEPGQQLFQPTFEITTEVTIEPTERPEEQLAVAPPIWTTGINEDDGSPVDSVEWFATDADVVYAAFETTQIPEGTSFSVSWLMNDVQVPGLNPTLVITSTSPSGWIEIHLDRTSESSWPEGTLTIELRVNGELISSGSTELRDD